MLGTFLGHLWEARRYLVIGEIRWNKVDSEVAGGRVGGVHIGIFGV